MVCAEAALGRAFQIQDDLIDVAWKAARRYMVAGKALNGNGAASLRELARSAILRSA